MFLQFLMAASPTSEEVFVHRGIFTSRIRHHRFDPVRSTGPSAVEWPALSRPRKAWPATTIKPSIAAKLPQFAMHLHTTSRAQLQRNKSDVRARVQPGLYRQTNLTIIHED